MALQNPVTSAWHSDIRGRICNSTLHTRLRTRAGQFLWSSTPTVPTLPTAPKTIRRRARRRGTTSLRRFALPDNLYNVVPAFFYRVIVSGTVTAQ